MIMTLRVFSLALVICCYATLAYSEFTLTPGVDLSVYYDDNIFLDENNEKDDYITTVTPNFSLIWNTAPLDVTLDASVAMQKYLDHTSEDRIGAGEADQATNLNALARIYPNLLFLRVSDTYARVPIDQGGSGGVGNTNVNMTDSNILQINPYLEFSPLQATQLLLGYTYENIWYSSNKGNNSYSHIFSGKLTRNLTSKFSASLLGSFRQFRPDNPDKVFVASQSGTYDYDSTSAGIGLTYQVTDRLTFNGEYGHTWINYDVISNGDSPTWLANLVYTVATALTVDVGYSKDYVDTVDSGPTENDRVYAIMQFDNRFKVACSLYVSKDKYVEIDQKDDSYGGELSGQLPFNQKIGIAGLVRYDNFDRTGLSAEEYDRYGTRLALYYDTRLGRLSTGHVYNRNKSNQAGSDYTNNIVFVSASLTF
jgi:hypothetical protein